MSELALSGFMRIVTNRRIYANAATIEDALIAIDVIRGAPNCVIIRPGENHWDIFASLCRETRARGPFVADAYFAALAIESDCEWISDDGDYARFPGLRWRRPFA
jgi:toxin-antitoxin system PIN domain toxin